MKVDKEYLAKHHFWFLLATYLPLVLLSLILLWTSVAGAIDTQANKMKKLRDETKRVDTKDVKNDRWISAFATKAASLVAQKNKVWKEVWDGQAPMFTWPELLGRLQSFEYGERIGGTAELNDLRDKYINDETCYKKQLKDMVAVVQPVNDKGEGVVQFRGGWENVIKHVQPWTGRDRALVVPSSEEIWLAQEDYWVQRELLQVIRDTNDSVAVYEKKPDAAKPARGEIDRQVFESPRWRLELAVTKDQLRWRITNRTPRKQDLGLYFKVTFKPQKTEPIWIDGEPVGPNQTSRETALKFDGFIGLKGIDSVVQVLDYRTAPVKRVDRIELGQTAHCSAGRALVAFKAFADQPDEAGAAAAAPGPGGRPVGPGGVAPVGPAMPGPGGMERPGGKKAEGGLGLDKLRYLEVSDQVRRMPLAMILIVDQTNMQDVLAMLARSRLRFQVTQVEWKRYRGSIQPEIVEARPEGGVGPGKVRPGGPRMPMAPPGAIGRPPIGVPGVKPPAQAEENEEDSSNLVEVAIYGITSLYMKYPPKAANPEAGAAPAPAVPPAGPPPAVPNKT
ncbi:hypothetical protein AYO40_04320 [Planctomycetaceae bacterium SCGC AG-212-D15]|nr:hypothetical protein AYO40_04320 [Planctomycetaceae bacterium SCGC AG-212-D15]